MYDKQPEASVAAHNMGAVLYNNGKYREVIPYFATLKSDKEHFASDYIFLANSYIAVDEPDSAYDILEYAAKNGAKADSEYYLSLGRDMITGQHYEPAAKFLSLYTRLQEKDARGYIALAECYYKLYMNSRYINTIDSGLKYCPDNYNLLNHKGYALFAEGKYALAIPYFEAALKNAPGYDKASRNLANCYRAIDSLKTSQF